MDIRDAIQYLFYLYILGVIVLLIYEDRDPSTTLAWAFAFVLVPVVTLPFYFIFGRDWKRLERRTRVKADIAALEAPVMGPIYSAYADERHYLEACVAGTTESRIITAVTSQNGTVPLPGDSVAILDSGGDAFTRLIEDLASATHHIHLQYFIWGCDELTEKVTEVLHDRLRAGVEVRIMYDFVGSIFHSKRELHALARAGAHVIADVTQLHKINYRNHRKIAVIDAAIGYTGGMNMAMEYIDGGKRFDTWRDTHLRVTGPFVAELQRLFAARWYERHDESLFDAAYFPPIEPAKPASRPVMQMAHSTVSDPWDAIRHTFMIAIAGAQHRVRIQSPYFVPDKAIHDAMITAALSGVTVEFMMTGVPDKRIPFWAAYSYFPQMLAAGVHIYQYTAGFFHPKTLTVDGRFASIGTANIDIRSLQLHDEMTVILFDDHIVAEQDAIFDADLAHCHEITAHDLSRIDRVVRFRNSLMRLLSRAL